MIHDRNYFVMLNTQKGTTLVPMVDEKEELALFETEAEARTAAKATVLGEAFGGIIFNALYEGLDV